MSALFLHGEVKDKCTGTVHLPVVSPRTCALLMAVITTGGLEFRSARQETCACLHD